MKKTLLSMFAFLVGMASASAAPVFQTDFTDYNESDWELCSAGTIQPLASGSGCRLMTFAEGATDFTKGLYLSPRGGNSYLLLKNLVLEANTEYVLTYQVAKWSGNSELKCSVTDPESDEIAASSDFGDPDFGNNAAGAKPGVKTVKIEFTSSTAGNYNIKWFIDNDSWDAVILSNIKVRLASDLVLSSEAEAYTFGADIVADKWYSFKIAKFGYNQIDASESLDNIVYTTNGEQAIEEATASDKFAAKMDLDAGTYYFKSSVAQTLNITSIPYEFPEGEVDLTTLQWVDEGFGCAQNLGILTGEPIYGTDAGPNEGKLSYFDVTDYDIIKVYGPANQTVRAFINRAEYPSNDPKVYEFMINIGEDGTGTLNLANVYAAQEGATYVHLNGFKARAYGEKARINRISVIAIKSMTIVGQNVTGSWNPEEGWDMTQNEENKNIWTYTFNNFKANAETYEYKAVANHNFSNYVLPAGDNQTFTFGTQEFPAGYYDLTFTANTSAHTVELAAAPHTYVVTFDNSLSNWETPYVWIWDNDNNYTGGEWPGVAMTLDEENGLYTYTFQTTNLPTGIIFSNGKDGEEKAQTADLEFKDAYTYKSDGTATGIESVNSVKAATAIYNMAGQRVVKAQKGLYIINGKKVMVK